MSALRDIIFCDKCQQSISKRTGGVRNKDKQYHKDCWKSLQPKFSFKKAIITCLVALVLVGGYARDDYTQRRITQNTGRVDAVAKYVAGLEYAVRNAFQSVNVWAGHVTQRLKGLDTKYAEQIEVIERLLEETKKEVNAIVEQQRDLVKDLRKGKMTDKQAAAVIVQLRNRANALEAKIQHLSHSPDELINKVIKPVIGIGVKDTKGTRLRGSGVLFKRVETKTDKGTVVYHYYGMTAYHVWDAIFQYKYKLKLGQLKEDKLKPELVIYVYDGRTQSEKEIVSASWVHPTKVRHGKYLPTVDFAVFTFTSTKKLEVAELATNQEIRDFKKYGTPLITAGVSPAQAPGIWMGTVANPDTKKLSGTLCHAYGYFGQSGGPTFDARTLKVVGINQRINVHMGMSPDTNTLFITTLDIYRVVYGAEKKNGENLDKLLD
jgi:hypothetical protein